MKYNGPKLDKRKLKKHFCIDMNPSGGFIKVKYKEIVDGDTALFVFTGSIKDYVESVRFNVVDAPSYYPQSEPFGTEALEYTKTILENAKDIYLESDENNNLRDDTTSKRLLAWIWVDGKLLNYLLVRNGLATVKYVISPNMKYLKELDEAEKDAIKEKNGIYNNRYK